MAKKLIDVQANGFKSYVDATAAAVGAEPALGNPGPGTFWLSSFFGNKIWVASIPWGEVSKSGAVASDVGAEPALGNPGPGTWFLKTISGVRSWVAQISWASVDKTGAVASDVGALPIANPTATETLTAPDVVVSNLAGAGTRNAAFDSTGRLVLAGAGDTVTATASSGALTPLTDTNIVSASLSAGKWLVSVNFHLYAGGSGAGSVTIFNSGISTTSATRLADNFDTNENLQSPLTFGMSRPYMCHRVVTLASPGTVYGVALIVATGPVAFFANAGLIATKLSD